eukprot:TCONS_00008164-protein
MKQIFTASGYLEKIPELRRIKEEKNVSVCVALPALNEEATIEDILLTIKSLLERDLVDEFFVIDAGSTDQTVEICRRNDVTVFVNSDVETLPEFDSCRGKGVQLWKSLMLSKSDVICWVDTDIQDFSEKYILGLIGPLIFHDDIQFTKAFYKRPLYKDGQRISDNGGGRVTELCARPLFNLLHPPLTKVIQPLSGEYAIRRHVAEDLRFSNGFGVETILLVDFYRKYGLEGLAQVDMDERIHRNKEVCELSKTSFVICQVLLQVEGMMNCPSMLNTLDPHTSSLSNRVVDKFTSVELGEKLLPSVTEMHFHKQQKETCEIFFVRHGQTDWNVNKRIQGHMQSTLNNHGRGQVEHLASKMNKVCMSFDQVYSSDLVRCMESCKIITDTLGVQNNNIKPWTELRERHFGDWEGKSHQEVRQEDQSLAEFVFTWDEMMKYPIPSAETEHEMTERICNVLDEITKTPGKKLVVTHSGFLHAVYRITKKIPLTAHIPTLDWKNSACAKLTVNSDLHQWDFDVVTNTELVKSAKNI